MAFNLFPKSGKSGANALKLELEDAPTISGRGKGAKAEKGSAAETKEPNRGISDTEMGHWAPQAGRIEVDETPELSPSLENAALMFAHGNATAATAALAHALDTSERVQPMVWMCLFDLHGRNGDRTAFEELALKFVVQFERSAPAWDELSFSAGGSVSGSNNAARAKPKSLLRGDVTDPQAPVIASLTEAAKRKDGMPPRFDLDVVDLNSVSDICGTLLAGSLSSLRRKGAVISFRGLESTVRRLTTPLQAGTRSHKGQWYLVLELLQWSGNSHEFEDRAVDFAVTFEISPPSPEPLTAAQRSVLIKQADEAATPQDTLLDDRVVWVGELKGAADPCLRLITVNEVTTNPVVVDMRRVLRVDFVCGGAIANAFTRLMAQAIDVRVVGASPIIQTLLQLTGTPASLFAKAA
jgi:anti-anti-sigma regulatory factor